MSGAMGPGVPIAEMIRFVTCARRLCVAAFETLGRRSVNADNSADRLGVAEASRQLGETLVLWESLLPDAVGLQTLADDVAAGFEAGEALTTFRRVLLDSPLGPVTRSVVAALRLDVAALSKECSPIADREFVAVLAAIAVRLDYAQEAAGPAVGDRPSMPVDQGFLPLLLAGTRNTFSSPLPVPN